MIRSTFELINEDRIFAVFVAGNWNKLREWVRFGFGLGLGFFFFFGRQWCGCCVYYIWIQTQKQKLKTLFSGWLIHCAVYIDGVLCVSHWGLLNTHIKYLGGNTISCWFNWNVSPRNQVDFSDLDTFSFRSGIVLFFICHFWMLLLELFHFTFDWINLNGFQLSGIDCYMNKQLTANITHTIIVRLLLLLLVSLFFFGLFCL